ncbi:unnamed protein product [Notodromas monacha]|uniref:Peroxisomal acyl-coenzyme A oxidase 1 n=1 Tax=Notodromas monacha TaxID=399045 RepID=A0A7R9BPM2_9CRUS|nr:unnamed protein product [Notodromas monacha]CAG0919319.1 unnamed protein product [Notodromas monacha]
MAPKENVDIAKERKSCSFDKRELTWLLDGGRDASERRKRMEEYILSQPGMYEGIGAYDFLSHEDRYTKSIEKGAKMLQLCLKADEVLGDGYQYEAMRMFNFPTLSGAVIPDGNPFNLHFVMFLTTLTEFAKMAPEENVDIAKERKSCSFDKRELTWLLDGGRDASERRKRMEEYILSQPGMYEGIGAYDFLSHEDRYTKSIEKGAKMLQLCLKADEVLGDGYQYEAMRMFNFPTLSGAVIPDGNPFNLHFVMFLTTLTGQGTLEQQTEWLGRAWNCEIIGTYAQTEIGHGTFLRGLETKAEYDPTTEEFVFNTPRLSATKWWPGSLGKTANYAIVPAHLYIHGVNYGMHTFIVQLRREEDHTSMPGITIGEIGPKYGMNSNDNGFLHLKNVRVPRKNMMMKHAQVLPDGTYVKPQNAKLSYGTMIFVRVVISQEVVMQLQKAVTIAVRYSAVRRQSKIEPEEAEVQVIDFVTQQFKLFPAIASVFAIHFAAAALWDDYLEVTASMGDGNLDRLPEVLFS